MSDATDLPNDATTPVGSSAFSHVAGLAGQAVNEILQGPLFDADTLHHAMERVSDLMQHVQGDLLEAHADTEAGLAAHPLDAAADGEVHLEGWAEAQQEMVQVGEALDATEAEALHLMASPLPADQLQGQVLMQQVEHDMNAIVEVLDARNDAIQSVLQNLHGDSGLEATPVEVALAEQGDAAHGHDMDHADVPVDAASSEAGAHHDDGAHAAVAETAAHDTGQDMSDHPA